MLGVGLYFFEGIFCISNKKDKLNYRSFSFGKSSMDLVYMVRHDSPENMRRFYKMTVSPGIFGEWSLVREWGRIGSPGTLRKEWHSSPEEARLSGFKIQTAKQKKGYQVLSSFEDR